MRLAGWEELDILLISGDAYVDHPAFGIALLGRWLVAHGFRVGVVAQPRWRHKNDSLADVSVMGRPRLFAGVTAGAVDSMLAHYTAFRKKRRDDAYTPGALSGARPNRACIVYTGLARHAFPGLPVVLGGIEASLRRVSHYDFWDDSLRRPLLQESKADILVYGMGERAVLEIAARAEKLLAADMRQRTGRNNGDAGEAKEREPDTPPARTPSLHAASVNGKEVSPCHLSGKVLSEACRDVPGTAWMASLPVARFWLGLDAPEHSGGARPVLMLPSHEAIQADSALLMQATASLERHMHAGGQYAVQESGGRALVLAPSAAPLEREEMDFLHDLPYTRLPHPSYTLPIQAWEVIRSSISTHRGCGGGCSFCSLALHQGRRISSRSRASIVREAAVIAAGPAGGLGSSPEASKTPRWAGAISDVGGPSANMWQALCALPRGAGCARSSCLHPAPCPLFRVKQGDALRLLREIASLPGVRHVRVASGLRFDLLLRDSEALHGYISEFTGGQIKVAPEHSEAAVLRLMRKPGLEVFERFLAIFARHCHAAGKRQYVVPYLMSAFPGCTEAHMHDLAAWLKKKHWKPQQVQCFVPTPGTVATAMFYARVTPEGEPLYVAGSDKERLRQHQLISPANPEGERHRERQRSAGAGTRHGRARARKKTGTCTERFQGNASVAPLRSR